MGSLHSLGTCFGPLFGKSSDVIGRKWTLIFISVTEMIFYIVLALSNNIYYVYLARFIQGLCFSLNLVVMPLFIAEIAETHNRGKFVTYVNLFMTFGNLYGFLLGSHFNVKTFTLICAAPIVVTLMCLIIFIPESPVYLVFKGKRDEAKQSFKTFRRISLSEVGILIQETEILIRETNQAKAGLINSFKDHYIWKPLLIMITLALLIQFSGLFALLSYFHMILGSARISWSVNICIILISILQILSVLLSSFLVERLGRKFLLLCSCSLVCLSTFSLGFYFFLNNIDASFLYLITWLPVVSVLVFIFGFGLGFCGIYFVIITEIFPPHFKTTAASIGMIFAGIGCFIVTFAFPVIRDLIGLHWCFWIFTGLEVFGFFFIYFSIPETKGKTFLEIQNLMKQRS